jgi:hypothetical protein
LLRNCEQFVDIEEGVAMAAGARSSVVAVNSIFRKGLFKGKAAIVTGGGTGIGKAITQELLFLGNSIARLWFTSFVLLS